MTTWCHFSKAVLMTDGARLGLLPLGLSLCLALLRFFLAAGRFLLPLGDGLLTEPLLFLPSLGHLLGGGLAPSKPSDEGPHFLDLFGLNEIHSTSRPYPTWTGWSTGATGLNSATNTKAVPPSTCEGHQRTMAPFSSAALWIDMAMTRLGSQEMK